jgi:hypothetical protein
MNGRCGARNSNRNRTSMTLELALRAAESAGRALNEGWRCRSTPGADSCCRWRCCRVTRCGLPGSGTARSHARRDRNSRAAPGQVPGQVPGRAGNRRPGRGATRQTPPASPVTRQPLEGRERHSHAVRGGSLTTWLPLCCRPSDSRCPTMTSRASDPAGAPVRCCISPRRLRLPAPPRAKSPAPPGARPPRPERRTASR